MWESDQDINMVKWSNVEGLEGCAAMRALGECATMRGMQG